MLKKFLIGFLAAAMLAGLLLLGFSRAGDMPAGPPPDPVFEGSSAELSHTHIAATLDGPIEPGKNTIWCASFQAAWKGLEGTLAEGPVLLSGRPEVADALNAAEDPRPHIPAENLYTKTGWVNEGVIDTIHADLARQFPGKTPPTFPAIAQNSFLAYGYLEVNAPFEVPYFQCRKPLKFTDATGAATPVTSFGIAESHADAYYELREQAAAIYIGRDEQFRVTSFAIDLNMNDPSHQIIVARIPPRPTLRATIADLADRMAKQDETEVYDHLYPRDTLNVPDLVWHIQHEFVALQGRSFANPKLTNAPLDIARQEIRFRLDRNGAELASESAMATRSAGTDYAFDRPFLLYMKHRDAPMPYFAMWVGNAELLNPW